MSWGTTTCWTRWSAAWPRTTRGCCPTFKEIVEELFVQGLVKAVFATETLALGINMPARSVVLESLVKWNGETHVDVTPGEYTQLTGRAGRRGIDIEGHAVVLWRPGLDPRALAGLAGTRTYPLRSSFKPSYNMAVNLVGQFGTARARELLETSFAQFQADHAVVGLTRQVQRNNEALDGYREAMTCHLGDFEEYAALRRELSDRETELSRQGAAPAPGRGRVGVEKLKPGDIIPVPVGPAARAWPVVLDPGLGTGKEGPRPVVLTAERQVVRLSMLDFPMPVEPQSTGCGSRSRFNPKSPQSRRDLASALRTKAGDEGVERDPAGAGSARTRPTTRRSSGCARRCARTRATAATTGRTTRAGPSATGGCSGTPSSSSAGSAAAPTPSPAPSTGSARLLTASATWTARG